MHFIVRCSSLQAVSDTNTNLMRRSSYTTQGQDGTTLVEALVVIVIISVVAAFAIMNRGSADEQFKRQNVARELKVAFERARFDSVKRRAEGANQAHVVVDAGTFTLVTDVNQDGDTLDAVDSLTTNFAGQNISISSDGTSLPVTVTFDKRGETTYTDDPVFLVCNGSCTFSNDTSANANIVLVTPTGTVNLLPGGSALPTFGVPTITNVSTTAGVNPDVVLP